MREKRGKHTKKNNTTFHNLMVPRITYSRASMGTAKVAPLSYPGTLLGHTDCLFQLLGGSETCEFRTKP